MECWDSFDLGAGRDQILAILRLVNERCRDNIPIFETITLSEQKFESLFKQAVMLSLDSVNILNGDDLVQFVTFLINLFKSFEYEIVRKCALRSLSLPMWKSLSSTRLARELESSPQIRHHWENFVNERKAREASLSNVSSDTAPSSSASTKGRPKGRPTKKRKKSDVADDDDAATKTSQPVVSFEIDWEAELVPCLIKNFISSVESISTDSEIPSLELLYIERFMELIIDLLSQLPTRRFLYALVDDLHILVRCRRSFMATHAQGGLFSQLLSMATVYANFEFDNNTGKALSTQELLAEQNSRLHRLQRIAFSDHPDSLKDLVFSSTGELGKAGVLTKHLSVLTDVQVAEIAFKLGCISEEELQAMTSAGTTRSGISSPLGYMSRDFVLEVLDSMLGKRLSQLEVLSQTALCPSEELLWDEHQIPKGAKYTGEQVLALPKLNLQFLTMHDYLLRNFSLFRLESAYEIREDLVDAIKRMGPRTGLGGQVSFAGWARMALPIAGVSITEVAKPHLGEVVPAYVTAIIELDLSRFKGEIRDEWESLRHHDVIFLASIRDPKVDLGPVLQSFERERAMLSKGRKVGKRRDFQWAEEDLDFPSRYGVQYIRGGEVFEVLDEDGVALNDMSKPDTRKSGRVGNKRRVRVRVDAAQYYSDLKAGRECYEGLNLLIRRKPKENNFRAILETIQDVMGMAAIGRAVPSWLHDVLLGYGDPASAYFRKLLTTGQKEDMDYYDTFLDEAHLLQSFPGATVRVESSSSNHSSPPYKICIDRDGEKDSVVATPYQPINMGPYPEDQRPKNNVRYTPVQVEAIRAGLNQGLTLIVGPPGTGKTDVACQIIAGLYRNHPSHKILVVAHSNAALNDLFEKIMQRNVDPRHLLRLGSGEADLRESLARNAGLVEGEEFSKQGRVNWSLARRLQLLGQVQRLAASLGITGDVGYTCETAAYFQLEHVQAKIEQFSLDLNALDEDEDKKAEDHCIQSIFPFNVYFADAPQPLFSGVDFASDVEVAQGCFRHINHLFEELADYRAFELLRTQGHRGDYLLTKQARIVAMTCTHAAMTRRRLVELGFKYDSLVMEEAGQILEVETLIPMLLQDVDLVDGCRLKRVVLIGDHLQLPPVIKHAAFQKYSHLDQSLFTRLVRLGVPSLLLDRQGRARSEIAALYSWRYSGPGRSLGDLDCVASGEYKKANAGLAHTFQLIDVPDFKGKGEHCPTPFFYQNLGEAEYVVAMYQYMRLLGYPQNKISILSTYNGQKHLIRDILQQRCRNPIFGMPACVSTVDKYQGQQNDYILLSLVRTESVGHLRDVRRLVVAASRARLGLYVFCRKSLFESCFELTNTFKQFGSKPDKLQLVVGEGYPTGRGSDDAIADDCLHSVEDVTAMGVLVYQMVQRGQMLSQQLVDSQAQLDSLLSSTDVTDSVPMLEEEVNLDSATKDEEEQDDPDDSD